MARGRYGSVYTNLQPRITKTLYEAFGDSKKPLPTQYGAIIGITNLGTWSGEHERRCLTTAHFCCV